MYLNVIGANNGEQDCNSATFLNMIPASHCNCNKPEQRAEIPVKWQAVCLSKQSLAVSSYFQSE